MKTFRSAPLAPLLLAYAALSAAAPAQSGVEAEYLSAAQLEAFVAQTSNGVAFRTATSNPASNTLIVRRDGPGEVERHATMDDIMVPTAGAATIILGGQIEGGRETAPDEWRGGKIVGGRSQSLKPRDLLWIPAGIPHQMLIEPGGSFTYITVKTERRPPAAQ